MDLNDAKELVRLITGERGQKAIIAGVVMIAPIFCRSFKVDDIVKATGFRRNQVERAALNCWRYGIWTNDDGWSCEWGKMFSDQCPKEDDEGDEMFRLQICFILDVLVVEGLATREPDGKEFKYRSLKPTVH